MKKQQTKAVLITSISSALIGAVSTAAYAEPYDMLLSEVLADEQAIIAEQPEGLALVMESIRTLDNEKVEAITVGNPNNPENVKRVESLVSEDDWNFLFVERHDQYTYLNFLKGIGKFPAFCGNYDDGRDAEAICRKSLATMFAHFTQETGGHNAYSEYPEWRQGLYYLREVGWSEGTSGGYGICDPNLWQGEAYPCGQFEDGSYKSYFGRGAKQLSYNYNYGPFSHAIYGNVEKLLNEPELVADTWLNLASAVFFYLYPQPPKPSMLHVLDGTWQPNQVDLNAGLVPGFGVTTMIINGGVECGGSSEHIQSQNRIDYYREFANYLDVPVPEDEVLGCANMQAFDGGGAGSLNVHWEEDWGWTPDTPSGQTYKCQLVAYQGPYSAFVEGDYRNCVEDKFDVNIINDIEGVPPTADAGGDITLYSDNTLVTLDGSGSNDPYGDIVSYQWQQDLGNTLEIINADKAKASVVVPKVDTETLYSFQLTVVDDDGETASDTMTITAKVVPDNFPPTVALTGPQSVKATETVTMTATVEDPDDTEFSFNWRASNGILLDVAESNLSASFIAPAVESETAVTVWLDVTDSANDPVTASHNVIVKPASTGEYPAWVLGEQYVEGDRVTNLGENYECKEFPYSAWCGVAEAYKPGEGAAWKDAWIKL
ncbi:glycoside hydrolase family 19 protein [Photobacterium satsumensis]|uniref:chitinase n=1 Tax=Photobacterium satsumensis TaxID=2910239 RepID=UPI003D0D33D9